MLPTKFQTPDACDSDEDNFLVYFYALNLGPLAQSHLGPWDLHLNKLGKRPLGIATYQIQASKQGSRCCSPLSPNAKLKFVWPKKY